MNTINKTLLAFLILISIINLSSYAQTQSSINYGDNKEAGNFKEINGIHFYYEIYGTGKPLIFLHGNGGSIKSASTKIEYFKKYFKKRGLAKHFLKPHVETILYIIFIFIIFPRNEKYIIDQ